MTISDDEQEIANGLIKIDELERKIERMSSVVKAAVEWRQHRIYTLED